MEALFFVEDPGAANFIAPLWSYVSHQLGPTPLLGTGTAVRYLRDQGIPVELLSAHDLPLLLREIEPVVLISGTSANIDSHGLHLIDIAKSLDIVTVAAVDAANNPARRFRGRSRDALAHAPDWMLVPDDDIGFLYEQLGYPSTRIVVSGHPHYDTIRDRASRISIAERADLRRRLLNVDDLGRQVIVFAAEPANTLDPSDSRLSASYSLRGRGRSVTRSAIVLEEFLDAIAHVTPRPYVVIRLHPRMRVEELGSLVSEADFISQLEGSFEVLVASDAVVGMTSMALVEAVLLGRPTLSIVPIASESQILPTTRKGITPWVSSRATLVEALSALLASNAQPDGKLIERHLKTGATARGGELLIELIRTSQRLGI